MGQRADGFVPNNAALVQDFLELGCGFSAPMRRQIRFPAHIDGIQPADYTQFIRPRGPQGRDGLRSFVAVERELSVNRWQVVALPPPALLSPPAHPLRPTF